MLKIITNRYWHAFIESVPLHIENLSTRSKLSHEHLFLEKRITLNAFTNIIKQL